MSTEEERAATFRTQEANRFRYKQQVEKAFPGDPAARKALTEKTKALLEVDEHGVPRAY